MKNLQCRPFTKRNKIYLGAELIEDSEYIDHIFDSYLHVCKETNSRSNLFLYYYNLNTNIIDLKT